tara:strand:- start:450 stop:650 length:201 start_codon:yes stop_codon:yes gene_type:complete
MNYIYEREQYSRELTKDEYRFFTQYIDNNYEEFYSNKLGYTVDKIEDKFRVVLTENSILNFNDIFK